MSTLRHRNVPTSEPRETSPDDVRTDSETETPEEKHQRKLRIVTDDDDEGRFISTLDIIRVIVTLVVLGAGLSYYLTSGDSFTWGYQRPWWLQPKRIERWIKGPINLTPDELALYNGTDPNLPLYLAINGTIFDVSANRAIYGPGGSYNFFVGRDATRAFVTGCFREDLTDDLRGVEEMYIPIEDDDDSPHERSLSAFHKEQRAKQERDEALEKVRAQVKHWVEFYSNHQKYFPIGKVVSDGKPKEDDGKVRPLCEGAKRNRPKRSELNRKFYAS
ncbi:hypothetical protein VTN31DRAFT_1094 [Thermomyces dupontii]|uniref:uncharacterized protein n=1 Tax=Talaromyces thermophilus TaxID=28565 RepID=UPI0037432E4F